MVRAKRQDGVGAATSGSAVEPSLEAWLASVVRTAPLTAKGQVVMDLVRRKPRAGAFSSVRQLADEAKVNLGTVTRTAQSLGFDGWTAFQQEFRSRYLASLSASQVAAEHDISGSTADASFARDVSDLTYIAKAVTREQVIAVAERIAAARHTVVLAQGSYTAVGIALAHNCRLGRV